MDSDEIKNFYDELADDYDLMTQFEKRFEKEEPAFKMLVERYQLKKVLDAGCGTGFHSILLAKLGCDVTSVDVSPKMLKILTENAKIYTVYLKTVLSSYHNLTKNVDSNFDAVFCLGNSLPHLLTHQNIDIALKNFYLILAHRGSEWVKMIDRNSVT
ncbi:MAG: class I SAM-dependent methyltransferase, partial [Bacteroidota bacterium]|nr:class I SAM-dependent methyltransferase [Bacteroidota bacterium]